VRLKICIVVQWTSSTLGPTVISYALSMKTDQYLSWEPYNLHCWQWSLGNGTCQQFSPQHSFTQSPFTSQSNTLWPLDFTWIPFSVPQDWLINPSVFPMELQCLLGARPIPTQLEKICSEFLICRKCRWWHLAHLHPQHKFDIAKSSSLFHTQDYVSSSFPTSLLPTSYLSKSRSLAWIWCKSIFTRRESSIL